MVGVLEVLWSSDSEVRKLSRRPLMRTSESKELQQLLVSSLRQEREYGSGVALSQA